MLFKLAFRNVKRQISNYLIYFITVALTVALIFALNNMIFSKAVNEAAGYDIKFKIIFLGISASLCVAVAFVLSFATSFLVRRRKKEFGLYLTLGMTRGNVLALFMGETLVTFLFSLGAGILLGMGVYQAFMAIFINFLEMEQTLSGYSATGFMTTVLTVGVTYLIASAFSLIYLRFASISRLLKGENTVEKASKYPVIWILVSAAAVALLVVSLVLLADWISDENYALTLDKHAYIFVLFVVSVIVLPFGISKSVVPLCVKRNEKTLSAKGAAAFTMRQLSGRLNANSVMAGVLTFLLLFSVIMPSIFLTVSGAVESDVRYLYHYDLEINLSIRNTDKDYSFEKEIGIIEKYADIKSSCIYSQYRLDIPYDPEADAVYEAIFNTALITESAYNKLCSMSGKEGIKLNGGYLAVYTDYAYKDGYFDFSDTVLELSGVKYVNEGTKPVPDDGMLRVRGSGSGSGYYFIVPDEAVEAENVKINYYVNLAVALKQARYNARAMVDDFKDVGIYRGDLNSDIRSFEYERLSEMSGIALWLLGCIFVAVTFILLSMAMLALKMLTMLEEDKRRYKTLWRLGADRGMIFRSLFSQMFFYYFIPFILPLISFVPVCLIILKIMRAQGYAPAMFTVFGQVAGVFGVIFALYALYFAVTYLIARQDIKRTLQSVG